MQGEMYKNEKNCEIHKVMYNILCKQMYIFRIMGMHKYTLTGKRKNIHIVITDCIISRETQETLCFSFI